MRRVLISSLVALALSATLGIQVVSAAKGKGPQSRHPVRPVWVTLEAENLTTNKKGLHITASAGDEVCIRLEVWNRSGTSQDALVSVQGGIPGCPVNVVQAEFFNSGQKKQEVVCGVVPEGESGVLTYDVSVFMTDTNDLEATSGSVTFGASLKSDEPTRAGIFQQIFARMMLRNLIALDSDGEALVSISELKALYR